MTDSNKHTTLTVELDGQRDYPIHIGRGLMQQAELLRPHLHGQQVCVVTNSTIAPLYLEQLCHTLQQSKPEALLTSVILPDGEAHKTLETLNLVFDHLLENKHNRTTTLVALGGGVIGDITGFAAASYQRGVNFIQIPTTILSQVDSSVGGKTGVNHPLGKNMIGAFYQPEAVIIDINVLNTLPKREIAAGVAEIIKYGMIIDAGFYAWLETNIQALMSLDTAVITHAIARSCECKAHVVGEDEKEKGLRAILNFGHTFGHAIEAHQGYGQWLHGEAVATGMLVATELSARLGRIDQSETTRLMQLLQKAELPTRIPANMSGYDFMEKMSVDKKVTDGALRLVLLESVGKAVTVKSPDITAVLSSIESCR